MGQYNANTNLSGDFVVDDISNAIALRSDIHRAFHDGRFVIVPKEGMWVVQLLGQTNTLGKDFYIVPSTGQKRCTRLFLCIFPGNVEMLALLNSSFAGQSNLQLIEFCHAELNLPGKVGEDMVLVVNCRDRSP